MTDPRLTIEELARDAGVYPDDAARVVKRIAEWAERQGQSWIEAATGDGVCEAASIAQDRYGDAWCEFADELRAIAREGR